MTSTLNKPPLPDSELPTLTPAIVQRAREGWEAASDSRVRQAIDRAFEKLQARVEGGSDGRVSGRIRQWAMRSFVRGLFRVRVENLERLPEEPFLLAANHLNHIDPLLLLAELPTSPYTYILGDARSLYNRRWKRFFLAISQGVIPLYRRWKEELAVIEGAKSGREDLAELAIEIERDVPDGKSIEMLRQIDRIAQSIFADGDSLMLFPEGKLGSTEGELLPLKRGAVTYALRSGVAIVPVALVGTKHLYLRKELVVRIGEPLRFSPSKRPKASQVTAATVALQQAIEDLLPQAYREPQKRQFLSEFLNRMFL
ncbi:MAG: lysophospholipid acyltransferase family protein [Cyanobacteriota bacterium]|nr:lysophospholipid acyltransferase family protein [Cyanobacteriota bacterium]